MTDLQDRFRRHLREGGLFPGGGTALLAVSGGTDSVAMLDLLVGTAAEHDLALVVGHVDHGIRPDSHEVADRVRVLAEQCGLRCEVVRVSLDATASETEARRERYRALRRLQAEVGARYLVTAHHADDQIETVLFRVLRGSGVAGLAGIAAVGAAGLTRPLLPFHREEIGAWVTQRGLTVDTDPSNHDQRHDRSWVRTVLLPELRARFGPDVDEHLLGVATDADRNRRAWSLALMAAPGLVISHDSRGIEVARAPLREYHNMLSQTLLRACAREVGCRVGAGQAVRLHDFATTAQSGKRMDLGSGWRAELAFDRLRIVQMPEREGPPSACRIQGNCGEARFGGWEVRWRIAPAGTIRRRGSVTWFPRGAFVVRSWQPGDRLVPFGGVGSRKVRRVLMEARVPRPDRATYPVIERDGEVVWVPGLCRAAGALPTAGAPAHELEVVEGTRSADADTTTRVDE